ncbi:MAG TPA: hypothetical protein VNS53_08535 [Sphingomicrobium sp.]|nr:hypothetical protein [Sphingomicrobium sp.]
MLGLHHGSPFGTAILANLRLADLLGAILANFRLTDLLGPVLANLRLTRLLTAAARLASLGLASLLPATAAAARLSRLLLLLATALLLGSSMAITVATVRRRRRRSRDCQGGHACGQKNPGHDKNSHSFHRFNEDVGSRVPAAKFASSATSRI